MSPVVPVTPLKRTRRRRPPGPRDAGVSAVAATIVLVAITTVLAAAVFLVVNGYRDGEVEAPMVGIARDEDGESFSIVHAPTEAALRYAPNPGDVGLRWAGPCGIDTINGLPPTNQMVVRGGDVLHTTCGPGQAVVLIDTASNKVVAIVKAS